MRTVRAKFECTSIEEDNQTGDKRIKMMAVVGSSGENADFTKYTPSGQFEMTVTKETSAHSFFEAGKSYYFDIIEATE